MTNFVRPNPFKTSLAALSCCALLLLGSCSRKTAEKTWTPGAPKRIASQTLLSDDILWKLGPDVRSRVVAVSALADHAEFNPSPNLWPKEVPRLGNRLEGLLLTRPDLLIMASFSSPEARAMATQSGVRVLVLDGFSTLDDYRRQVIEVADAVAQGESGKRLVAEFDDRVIALKKALQPPPARCTASGKPLLDPSGKARPTTVLSWSEGMTAGAGTTFSEVTKLMGVSNIAEQHGINGHQKLPLEKLLIWNPQYIVIACSADHCAQASSAFYAMPGIASLSEPSRPRILTAPPALLTALGDGTLELAKRLSSQLVRCDSPESRTLTKPAPGTSP